MKNRNQRRSRLQERRIAEEVEGKVQPGSGNTWSAKGDVRKKDDIRIEAKHTSRANFDLKLKDLLKIRSEAIRALETWVMQVEHVGQHGSRKYAVCDWNYFHHIHAFSQTSTLILREFWTPHLSFRINFDELDYFLWEAIPRRGVGVYRIAFSHYKSAETQTVAAIFQWDHFLEIHEAYKP